MESGDLTRDDVLPLLDTEDAALQQAVLEVISHREGWSDGVVEMMREWMSAEQIEADRLAIIRRFLTARASESAVQSLIKDTLAGGTTSEPGRLTLLEVMESAESRSLARSVVGTDVSSSFITQRIRAADGSTDRGRSAGHRVR